MAMVKKAVKVEIDRVIKDVWLHEICEDYGTGQLLREASLQCSFYHHLRSKMAPLLARNSLAIYPEFYFPSLKYRADLAIVEMDFAAGDGYLSQRVTDIAAIIELKYDGGNAATTETYIKSDMPKMKEYVRTLPFDCQYYFGVIYETECVWLHWFDKRSTNNWARGRLTELNAGLLNGLMFFEINSYNELGIQQKQRECEMHW